MSNTVVPPPAITAQDLLNTTSPNYLSVPYSEYKKYGYYDANLIFHPHREFTELNIKPVVYPDKFYKSLYSQKRYDAWVGGNGSGKSTNKAKQLLYKALDPDIFFRLLFVRHNHSDIKKSVYQMFKDVATTEGIYDLFRFFDSTFDIQCNVTGHWLFSAGLDNTGKLSGINDITENNIIGDINTILAKDYTALDTLASFTEAYRFNMQYLKDSFPNALIYAIQILPSGRGSQSQIDEYRYAINRVCENLSIPVIQADRESGLNYTLTYMTDSTHLNSFGNAVLADYVIKKIAGGGATSVNYESSKMVRLKGVVTNCDTTTQPGIYTTITTTTNCPVVSNNGHILQVFTGYDQNGRHQVFYATESKGGSMWKRYSSDGGATWGIWREHFNGGADFTTAYDFLKHL